MTVVRQRDRGEAAVVVERALHARRVLAAEQPVRVQRERQVARLPVCSSATCGPAGQSTAPRPPRRRRSAPPGSAPAARPAAGWKLGAPQPSCAALSVPRPAAAEPRAAARGRPAAPVGRAGPSPPRPRVLARPPRPRVLARPPRPRVLARPGRPGPSRPTRLTRAHRRAPHILTRSPAVPGSARSLATRTPARARAVLRSAGYRGLRDIFAAPGTCARAFGEWRRAPVTGGGWRWHATKIQVLICPAHKRARCRQKSASAAYAGPGPEPQNVRPGRYLRTDIENRLDIRPNLGSNRCTSAGRVR